MYTYENVKLYMRNIYGFIYVCLCGLMNIVAHMWGSENNVVGSVLETDLMQHRLAWNSRSTCLHLPGVRIILVCHYDELNFFLLLS